MRALSVGPKATESTAPVLFFIATTVAFGNANTNSSETAITIGCVCYGAGPVVLSGARGEGIWEAN